MALGETEGTTHGLFRSAVSAFPLPILVSNVDRILYANAAAASFLEAVDTTDLAGRAIDSFIHGACIEASRARRSLVVATGQRIGPVSVKALTCAHHCHLVSMDSWPVTHDGDNLVVTMVHGSTAPVRPMLAADDSSPLLSAIAREILETMPVPTALHDRDCVVFANAAVRRCLCGDEGERLEGRHFSDFVHEDGRAAGAERRNLLFAHGPALRDIQAKLVALDGTPRYAKGAAMAFDVEDEPYVMITFDSISTKPAS